VRQPDDGHSAVAGEKQHERRERELGLSPANRPAIALRLAVGDLVVYASHGIGRVESRQSQQSKEETLVLVFESGLKVTLPLDRAHEALRSLSGEPELKEVQRTLRADSPPAVEPWSRRHRRSQAKLAAGSATGLAEIVRDGIHRQRRRVKGGPAPVENQLFRQARTLLAAEIATSRGIELDEADAWIAQQTTG
jgi:RNA polymerase-interacting CarD/CdnL/TRCF family regulator